MAQVGTWLDEASTQYSLDYDKHRQEFSFSISTTDRGNPNIIILPGDVIYRFVEALRDQHTFETVDVLGTSLRLLPCKTQDFDFDLRGSSDAWHLNVWLSFALADKIAGRFNKWNAGDR